MRTETTFKRALVDLAHAIIAFEKQMDALMKLPSDVVRGRQIAKAINDLTIANQRALHFTLGYSFKKINKLYGKD